ncbi:hypothetical protein IE81DRAFT_67647 [Ceraceosorus guamensis]|uniref:Uncharacterized protein n=1 Tax=Ceraceosorus guamensis TaxID=1522189 RepID=A0A316W245_9BASI|nr:hypothetical protein IE81DRAFT_67647 [Ceraceosorus guamensis]PWN43749.1 hypothetical protein IE81DRAFT_67647 [Ceraceosorus guamensis]
MRRWTTSGGILDGRDSSTAGIAAPASATGNTALDPPTGRGSTSASSSSGTPHSSGIRSGVVRRAVRRSNLTPRDRSIMRVAATLQDESRPTDSEVASEAKLARKLCGEDGPVMPPISRNIFDPAASRAGPPFDAFRGINSKGFGFGRRNGRDTSMSPSRDGDAENADSATSDDDLGMSTSYQARGHDTDEEKELREANNSAGDLDDSTDPVKSGLASSAPSATKRGSLWMGFRDVKTRQSPGSERLRRARTPGAMSTGSVDADQGMPGPLSLAGMMSATGVSANGSPGFVGRSAKRKMGADERFDPYTSSAYKRRAVSPATLILGSGATHPLISPSLSATPASSALGAATTSGLPNPTPLSIPSPTIGFSAGLPGNSGNRGGSYFATHFPSRMSIGAGAAGSSAAGSGQPHMSASRSSRSGSPATRPSTPTGCPPPFNAYSGGAGPSPGMLSSSAGKSGSGPGYGSGALGLSISGNSAALGLGLGRARGASLLGIDDDEEATMDDGVGAMRLNNEGEAAQPSAESDAAGDMK